MALKEAVADTLSGVEKESVVIDGVETVSTRRLDAERRLNAGSVKVSYTIVLPQSYAGPEIKAASIVPATLMKNINTRIAAKGVTGGSVTEVPTIAVVTQERVGTPLQTSGSVGGATLGFLVGLLGFSALLK